MAKPIQDEQFWNDRIEHAINSRDLRLSVFHTTKEKWQQTNADHKQILSEIIKDGDSVLDAGCGYGRLVDLLPRNISYKGIDQCERFISLAKRDYPEHSFEVGSLQSLSFSNNEFDWCVCVSIMDMVLQNCGLETWRSMQSELLRVSKKGIVCLEYTESKTVVRIEDMKT